MIFICSFPIYDRGQPKSACSPDFSYKYPQQSPINNMTAALLSNGVPRTICFTNRIINETSDFSSSSLAGEYLHSRYNLGPKPGQDGRCQPPASHFPATGRQYRIICFTVPQHLFLCRASLFLLSHKNPDLDCIA